MSRREHFDDGRFSAEQVAEHNNDYEGPYGASPDTHERVAEHLGVHPSQVSYTLRDYPMSSFPGRGAHNFDPGPEQDYVRSLARHADRLPPVVAAEGSYRSGAGHEPVRVVDGQHRLAAHAEAGSSSVPVYVGSATHRSR